MVNAYRSARPEIVLRPQLCHPEAKYFHLGPIDQDQMQDYADRKGLSPEKCEKWLAPNRGVLIARSDHDRELPDLF